MFPFYSFITCHEVGVAGNVLLMFGTVHGYRHGVRCLSVCLQRRSRYVMLRTTSRWIKMVNVIDCWNPSDCLYIPFHWISCAITSKQHVAFYVWIMFYAAVVYIYNELTVLPVYAASFRYKTDALQRQHEFAIYFPVLDWCIAFYFIVLQTFLSVCLSVAM